MCLFCGCGGSHVETSPRGIIKSESLQSEAWGSIALGRSRHLTLQFSVEDSRRRWWSVHLRMNWQTDGGRESLKYGTTYCFAGGFLAQEVAGRPDYRRRARMDENLFLTDAMTLGKSHTSLGLHWCRACTVIWLISALLLYIYIKKKEHRKDKRRLVAAHILEWKNWAIICYFAVNISTLCLQPLK